MNLTPPALNGEFFKNGLDFLLFLLYLIYVMINNDELWQVQEKINPMKEGVREIMSVEETAKYLKMESSTLYKMARESKIPAVKIEIIRNSFHNSVAGIHTHMSTKNLSAIKNPLHSLLAGGRI